LKVILVGTGVQLKLRKHPNAYIAIKWNLNLLVITFLTTLTPLARVILRNDASFSTTKMHAKIHLMFFFTTRNTYNYSQNIIHYNNLLNAENVLE
jgi:hypothetical protein